MSSDNEYRLFKAAECGDLGAVRMLLDAGTDPNAMVEVDHSYYAGSETPLHVAAREAHVEVCKALLDAGANISAGQLADGWGAIANTPLHAAVQGRGRARTVETYELLLAHGASPNTPGLFGETPLHKAVFSDSEFIVPLLKHGGDLTLKNDEGLTPLGIAVGGGDDVEACQRWVEWGCDPRGFDIKDLLQSKESTPEMATLQWLADLRGESLEEWSATYG